MAADSDIQLKVSAAVDGLVEIAKLIAEVDSLGGQTRESSVQVDKLVTELDKLREQDQLMNAFGQLKRSTTALSDHLDVARDRATSLGKGLADAKAAIASANREYAASKTATKQLADEWAAAKAKVDLLKKGIEESNEPTRAQREELKAARAEAKSLGEQYKTSAKETAELGSALSSSQKAVKQQAKEFNSARNEVSQLDTQYQRQQSTLNGLRTELQQSGLNTKNLAAEQRNLKSATEQAEQQVRGLADKVKDQADQQRWMNEQVGGAGKALRQYDVAAMQAAQSTQALGEEAKQSRDGFAGWAKGILATATAMLSLDKAKDLLLSLVSTGAQMETLAKSAQQLGIAFDDVNRFAIETPLQLDDVMNAAIQAKNFGLDPFAGSLQAATDAAAAQGKGAETVQSIILALGQAYGKTKLQQQEVLQLINAGIPAWDLLAQATGKSIPELQDLSSAGKLGKDTIELLINTMGSRYAGAAKSMMQETAGLWSNLQDEWVQAKNTLATQGLMEYVKDQLSGVISHISALREDGTLQAWGQALAQTLRSVGQWTKLCVDALSTMAPALKAMGTAWVGLKITDWIAKLTAVETGYRLLGTSALTASGGITQSALAANIATHSFGGLNPVIRASVGLVGLLKNTLLGLAAGWGIEQILSAAEAYGKMRDAQAEAAKSSQAAQQSARLLQSRLGEVSRQVGINITSMAEFNQLLDEGTIHFDEASGTYQQGAEAIQQVGAAATVADPRITAFYQTIDELRQKLGTLKPGSDEATQVVTGLFDAMEVSSRKSVSVIISQLTELEAQGQITAKNLQDGLSAKIKDLSSSDLATLQTSLSDVGLRMDEVGNKARQVGDKLNVALFTRLGLDLSQMRTGFPQAGTDIISVFGQIASSGQNASAEIRAAFEKAIDATKTQQEANTLIEIYQNAGRAGAVSMSDIAVALEKNKAKTQELATGTGDLGNAYDTLGVKSAEALALIAQKSKAAYEGISRSTATIEVQREAFLAYAEAELTAAAASGRYVDGSLAAQAAALGLTDQLSALQKTIDTTGSRSLVTAAALDQMGASAAASANKTEQATSTLSDLEQTQKKVADGAQTAAAYIANYSAQLTEMARAMSPATEAMMSQMMGWTRATHSQSDAVGELNTKLRTNADEWRRINSAITYDDIQGYIKQLGLAYLTAERAYLRQKQAVESMSSSLTSASVINARMLSQAEGLLKSSTLLGEEDLGGLRSALSDAKQKMASLKDSAESTLRSLRDELDQYNNNLDAVEQRRYDSQIATLSQQLADAQSQGNKQAIADLRESLRLAEEIHQKKRADIKQEKEEKAKAKAKADSTSSTTSSTTTTTANTGQSQAVTPVTNRVVVEIGSQQFSIDTTSSGESTLKALLNQLSTMQRRS